ncbi:MAG: hypothetical protein KGK03_10930, partial [Candidatus Omnitrophica bacterium]|nr:hypothetical protein [Candidatus Omnitrophota bacterium]
QNSAEIQRLVRVGQLNIDVKTVNLKNMATALVGTIYGTIKIFVPLEGVIDLETEKKRMHSDILQKRKSLEALIARLNNPDFSAKAPQDVVIKEKERLESLIKEISALEGVLASLS